MRKITANKKSLPLLMAFIVIIFYFLFFTFKYQAQIYDLKKQKKELAELIDTQKQQQLIYMEELSRVGTNEYYEYLARKYLGYIYPNEKVMVWIDPQNQ